MAGVVVGVATVPANPLADTTDTDVTEPPPPPPVGVAHDGSPEAKVRTCVSVPFGSLLKPLL